MVQTVLKVTFGQGTSRPVDVDDGQQLQPRQSPQQMVFSKQANKPHSLSPRETIQCQLLLFPLREAGG